VEGAEGTAGAAGEASKKQNGDQQISERFHWKAKRPQEKNASSGGG
jgi:hypothetical protein